MFYQPKSIGEALDLKAKLQESGAFIAGGTDLVVVMNRGIRPTKDFVDLSHVKELTAIGKQNGTLELAGNVTFAQAGKLSVRCLAQASLSVGGPGIRELGTLAGNLATASPAGDGSTALLALDAEVELSSVRGVRRLPLDKFFLGYRKTALAPDEMITKVSVPTNYRTDWSKNGKRGAMNISIVAAAVAITPKKEVRIALASVAPTPIRCYEAEKFLTKCRIENKELSVEAVRRFVARSNPSPIIASAKLQSHLSV